MPAGVDTLDKQLTACCLWAHNTVPSFERGYDKDDARLTKQRINMKRDPDNSI